LQSLLENTKKQISNFTKETFEFKGKFTKVGGFHHHKAN